jgi:hypothetical protein
VLRQFGSDGSVARRRYVEFVLDKLQDGHQGKYYEVKDQRYLGADSFIERVEIEAQVSEDGVYDIPIGLIVKEVGKAAGISLERLYSSTRDRKGAYGRSMIAYLARRISGHLLKDIAQHFRRSPMTMSQGVIKFEGELRHDRHSRDMVEKLKADLIRRGKRKYHITIA